MWLLVSPGNPLKPREGMAPFAERLASAEAIADGRRVLATPLEARLGHRRTERTLARLRQMFPLVRFVFIIGADNLWQLPRWGAWRRLARHVPLAVLPRPGWTRRALRGMAVSVLRRQRREPAALLDGWRGPRDGPAPWCLIPAREHAASATALRAARTRVAHVPTPETVS